MKKKILITGASGFIGRNLKELLGHEYKISAPSHKELELLDEDKVERFLKTHKFDVIVHSATHNATRTSTKDLSRVFYSNLRIFFNLARYQDLYGRMFYFGSGAEYDSRYYIPKMKEEYFDQHVPVDDYGFSKYIMAKYTNSAKNIYDLRLFGVFGKWEDWRIRFISNAICFALHGKDFIMNQNVYFDYLYINDLVKIVKKFIEAENISYKHFNVCNGESVDLLSLAQLVVKISEKKINIKIRKKGFKKEYSGDNSRLLQQLGSFTFTPLDVAVKELYLWYSKNKHIIDKKSLVYKYG